MNPVVDNHPIKPNPNHPLPILYINILIIMKQILIFIEYYYLIILLELALNQLKIY